MVDTKTRTKPKQQQQVAGEVPQGNLPAVHQEFNEFRRELEARRRAYEPKLPPHIPWDEFQSNIWTAVQNEPKLLECNRTTLWNACAEAAELGLSLNKSLRLADIIPRWDKRLPTKPGSKYTGDLAARLLIRYGGYQQLARQSGEIVSIEATEVCEWDFFDYERGLNPRLEHKPGNKPEGYEKKSYWGVTHTYVVWEERNGKRRFEVVDLHDILRIARLSDTYDKDESAKAGRDIWKGPWANHFTEQCKKTAMRRASKWMPQSTKLAAFYNAVRLDDIREGGREAHLRDGDVVDITDFGPAEEGGQPSQQQKPAQRQEQMDDLESRMASNDQRQGQPEAGRGERPSQQTPAASQRKAPQQQAAPRQGQAGPAAAKQPAPAQQKAVAKLEPPVIDGKKDLETWVKLAEAAVADLSEEQRAEWKNMHGAMLDACEYTMPHLIGGLVKMLP